MTWGEIVTRAYRQFNVKGIGRSLNSDEMSFGLELLKDKLDAWSLNGHFVPGYERHVVTVPDPAKATYNVGPNEDINVVQVPFRLDSATFKGTTDIDFRPLNKMDHRAYQEIATTLQGRPWGFYYEARHPIGIVSLSSVPLPGDKFAIHYPRYILPDGDLDPISDAVVPLGYERYMYLSLALELSDSQGIAMNRLRRVTHEVTRLETTIREGNRKSPRAFVDSAVRPRPGNMLTRRRGGLRW